MTTKSILEIQCSYIEELSKKLRPYQKKIIDECAALQRKQNEAIRIFD